MAKQQPKPEDVKMPDGGAPANKPEEEKGADTGGASTAQESGAPPANTGEESKVSDGPKVDCAILHDSFLGKHGEIVSLDADLAALAELEGYVDTHPNALAALRGEQ